VTIKNSSGSCKEVLKPSAALRGLGEFINKEIGSNKHRGNQPITIGLQGEKIVSTK